MTVYGITLKKVLLYNCIRPLTETGSYWTLYSITYRDYYI